MSTSVTGLLHVKILIFFDTDEDAAWSDLRNNGQSEVNKNRETTDQVTAE